MPSLASSATASEALPLSNARTWATSVESANAALVRMSTFKPAAADETCFS